MKLDPLFVFAAIFGLYTLIGTTFKPKFYWEHPRMRHAREFFGDQKTRIVYAIAGGLLFLVGLTGISGLF